MADKSAIEWTDATWNPTVGCSIASPGCTNCYAMQVAHGLQRRFDSKKYGDLTKVVNDKPVWTGEVRLDETALLQPLKWKRSRRIFVNSMSDLFHEKLSDTDIDRVFAVMALCPQHTFQVLTKRAERMRSYLCDIAHGTTRWHSIDAAVKARAQKTGLSCFSWTWPLPNVWLGVSAERQQEADERIPLLLQTPAAVRFVSLEPLLGPIDLNYVAAVRLPDGSGQYAAALWGGVIHRSASGYADHPSCGYENTRLREIRQTPKLDWVIVGGESGPDARPMHPDWARSLRVQCEAAGVPFFFKQWGEYGFVDHMPEDFSDLKQSMFVVKIAGASVEVMRRVGKKKAGRRLDGREHNEFPVIDSSKSQRGLFSPDSKPAEATPA